MLHDIGRVRVVRRVLNQVHRVVMIVKGSASAVTLFHELFSTLSLKALKEMIISEEWESVAVARSEEGELSASSSWMSQNDDETHRSLAGQRQAGLSGRHQGYHSKEWDAQLHNPLHAMGWLLNPRNQYGKEVKNDPEVRLGAEAVIQARGGDVAQRALLLAQFHKGEGLIGSDDARWAATVLVASGRLTEAEWWLMYGGELRALMGMAVTVLSQPVTSSEVERYWSAIARVQRRDRNRLSANKMMDVTEVAFARRARDAFDRKSRQREKLYADLANGTLQQGSAVEPAAAEEEEVGDDEEEGEGNEQLCTIDWDLFGNIGKRKKKGPKTAKKKRNGKAKKPTRERGRQHLCERKR
ncbi:unnamed protein product [Closterium sp. NIES-64]|nr:unnamed protein product [Closterium sp. NIES-64]